jgi:hypothetical protein
MAGAFVRAIMKATLGGGKKRKKDKPPHVLTKGVTAKGKNSGVKVG